MMTKIREGYKETEIGVIPEDWEVNKIKDYAETMSGGTPSRQNPEFYTNGTIPWIKTGELGFKYIYSSEEHITELALKKSSAKLADINSVLLAMYGATIGKSSILKVQATTNQACCIINPNPQIVNYEYLYYFLEYDKERLIEKGAGGAQPNISQNIIKLHDTIVPPLPEQERIAEILSTTDNHIEKLDKTIENYQLLKKGMMKKLLTEGIGHTEFKETEIGRIPKEWEVVPLSFVTEFIRDGSHGSHKEVEDGIPLLSAKDIINDKVQIPSDCRRISQSDYYKLHKNYELQPGDVLLTIVGTIGRTAIIEKITEKITFQRSVGIIRAKETIVPLYLKGYFDSSIFQNQLKNSVNASAQGGVYLNTLSNLMCIVPSIEEQELIADNLFEIVKLIELLKEDRNDLVLLKKSLMDKLLTGKVRVM